MGTYTTVLGDTWDMISFKVYGKEKYAKDLIEANSIYSTIVIFSAGITLKIPEITVPVSSSLPPWKRGVINAGS